MAGSAREESHADDPFIYMRHHGPEVKYAGDYGEEALQRIAAGALRHVREDKEVYMFFNNTMGNAPENALCVKSMIDASNGCFLRIADAVPRGFDRP